VQAIRRRLQRSFGVLHRGPFRDDARAAPCTSEPNSLPMR
jgi:hypothetical protein